MTASAKNYSAPVVYGCMMIGGAFDFAPLDDARRKKGRAAIEAALECGINFFDHADFYCYGKSETLFGEFLRDHASERDHFVVQSKCGIILPDQPEKGLPGRFDLSYQHIMGAVEGSLKRLQTGYLDVLLLHRPDPLVEPEEVARAFDELHRTGRVRSFGVSNHSPAQIELLQAYVDHPLRFNQIEYNPLHTVLHDAAIHANMRRPDYGNPGEGIIEYCRLHDIQLQAWAPLAKGLLTGNADSTEVEPRVKRASDYVARLAAKWGASREAVVIGWILRHPARIQPVIGTTNPDRLRAACEGLKVKFSREEWYQLYTAAMGHRVP